MATRDTKYVKGKGKGSLFLKKNFVSLVAIMAFVLGALSPEQDL
jgi:hypothetical protein